MKGYIRSLSIDERKTYVCAISYTFFQSISCILVKIMISWYKIKSLTLICEGGSIIAIMCISRIIVSIRNNKTKNDELLDIKKNKWVLVNAVVNSLCLIFSFFSLAYTSISTYTLILNQSSLLTTYLSQYLLKEKIPQNHTLWYIMLIFAYVIIISSIMFRSLEDFLGVFFALLGMTALSFSHIVNRKTPSSQIDTLILFIGIYSAAFGCLFIIIFTNEIGELSFLHWILIFLKASMTYYMLLFQIKALRDISNANKLIPFSLFSILISLLSGYFLFDEEMNINQYIGYGLTFIFIYAVSTKILQPSKKNKLLDRNAYYDNESN